jgi:hypothetical protein
VDKDTLAGTTLKKALGLELFVYGVHRVAADAQVLGHLTAGRHLAPGRISLVEYPFGQLLIQLVLQWMLTIQPEIVNHVNWSHLNS